MRFFAITKDIIDKIIEFIVLIIHGIIDLISAIKKKEV